MPPAMCTASGAGAMLRPASSISSATSMKPKPMPPCSSGTATPSSPASASLPHSPRSKRSLA